MRTLISAFILCLSLMCTAADTPPTAPAEAPAEAPINAAPPAPPPPPINALSVRREQQQNALLQKWYGEQTVTLKTHDGTFVGIWQDDTSGKPLGALLMLHDASQMPDWPGQLQPLRNYLSQHGWATLSISLPEPDARVLPARPEPPKLPPPAPSEAKSEPGSTPDPAKANDTDAKTAEPAAKPVTKDGQPPETQAVYNDATGQVGDGSKAAPAAAPKQEVLPSPPAEPLAQERISAALALLKEKRQYNNSLLGVGLGAARAAYFMLQHQGDPAQQAPDGAPLTPPFQTLLLINPQMQIKALPDFALLQALTNPKIPVLDIAYRNHPAAPNTAATRKAIARKNKLAVFEQHLIEEPQGSDVGEEQVNRMVRGFLVKYAQGKQIQGRSTPKQ